MKKFPASPILIGICISLAFMLSACMPGTIATLVSGAPENYTDTDSLTLDTLPSNPDILDICADVGKKAGLVANRSSRNMLMLSSHSQIGVGVESAFREALIGTAGMKVYSIMITLSEPEKKLNIMTQISASKDARKKAEDITREFKAKVSEALKTQQSARMQSKN